MANFPTEQDDVITGTDGVDTIDALGGNDRVNGGGGNDQLDGGAGNDTINGEAGDDTLKTSGPGNDAANGGVGEDILVVDWSDVATAVANRFGPVPDSAGTGGFGGALSATGRDVTFSSIEKFDITTGSGNDRIATATGDDIVKLGLGDDFANVGSGLNQVDGGDGEDGVSADFSGLATAVEIDLRNATNAGAFGAYSGIEYFGTVTGTAQDDVFITTGVNRVETINLGGGNDRATVFNGLEDVVNGGTGNDTLTIDYSAATRAVTSRFGPIPDSAGTGGFAGAFNDGGTRGVNYSSIENFIILTGSGADHITTATGNDIVRTGAGDDIVNASAGDDLVDGGDGNDTLNGGDGTDRLSYESAATGVTVSLAVTGPQNTVGAGADTMTNFENLTGSAFADSLTGTGGNNAIDGGAGADTMIGLGGNDTFVVDNAGDVVTENAGEGADEIRTALASYRLNSANVENLTGISASGQTLIGDENPNVITGSAGDDTLVGNEGADTLNGGDGVDTVDYSQEAGNVLVRVNLGASAAEVAGVLLQSGQARDTHGAIDTLTGIENIKVGGGGAVVLGSDADNRIEGGAGGDSLVGAGGNDTLIGNGGVDFLDGGSGADTMIGGAESDVYFVDNDDDVVIELADEGDADRVETDLESYSLVDLPNVENLFSLLRAFGGSAAGETQTLIGNSGNNSIQGSEADDTINGLAGDDRIDVGGGVNQADGGEGEDGISFGLAGLATGANIDLRNPINSGAYGSFSNFEYFRLAFGSAQSDNFVSTAAARPDEINLGEGDDSATVFNGDDIVNGGSGTDTLVIDYRASTSAVMTIRGPITSGPIGGFNGRYADTAGRAIGYTSIERFIITTGSGTDRIVTATGDDEIRTGLGNDTIVAGAGNDFLDGGEGGDLMNGGAGNDIYIVDAANDFILEQGNAGDGDADEVRTALSSYTLAANVENLTGTSATAQSLRGNASNNMVVASSAGADIFFLQDGGDDKASGGAGDDGFYFGAALAAADEVDGGEGALDQVGLQGDYSAGLTLGEKNLVGIEQLVLLPGSDTRFGDTSAALYSYTITTTDANVGAGQRLVVTFNTLRAGENVTFDGSAETDGFFLTYGGFGTDILTGGQKDDAFFFGRDGRFGENDRVDGQGGSLDQLGLQGDYTGASAIVFGADQIKNVEQIVLLTGGDTRFGGAGEGYSYDLTMDDGNVLANQTLVITANRLASNETLTFDGSAEIDGRYRVFSGDGADAITGGAGDDEIFGRGGVDRIGGGGGADRIIGGLGGDFLTGGAGGDTFVYASAAESTSVDFDTLIGFDYNIDRVDLPNEAPAFSDVVQGGRLDQATFDADLVAALDGVLGAGEAAVFIAGEGSFAGRTFGIVDANGVAGYQAGEDFVFELVDPVVPGVPTTDFFI